MKSEYRVYVKRWKTIYVWLFLLLLVVTGVVFSMTERYIDSYITRQSLAELTDMAESQGTEAEHLMENEFTDLEEVRLMMESGLVFGSGENVRLYSEIADLHRFSRLAYADLNGNTVDCLGEKGDNIAESQYFREMIGGEKEQVCVLSDTGKETRPTVIYAVPVTDGGKVTGMLIAEKPVDALEEILFEDADIAEGVYVCITDENGSIVAENDASLSGLPAKNDSEVCRVSRSMENGWTLYCETARSTERAAHREHIVYTWACVIIGYLAVIGILGVHIHADHRLLIKLDKEDTWAGEQVKMYKEVLGAMQCGIVDFDVASFTLESDPRFDSFFHSRMFHGEFTVLAQMRLEHPEFGFDELQKVLALAVNEGKSGSFESFISVEGKMIWIHAVLFPVIDLEGHVSHVLAAVQDVTKQHRGIDRALEILAQTPGGIHRCYLSEPCHVEYVSEALIRMLGYTQHEFEELIGPEKDLTQIMPEEDRPRFEEFVCKMAASEHTSSIKYHVVTKSGKIIPVSDTMESKRSDSGIMYGYSAITDISSFEKETNSLAQELEKTRKTLERTRVLISTSQMQPHFLYNALSSIREIVLSDPNYASDLIYNFTVHLRACIKSMTNDDLIPLSKELENIRSYVEIEKMRFGEKLKLVYDIHDGDIMIIPLGIQPLVENSIRHGIYHRGSKGGTVTVRSFPGEHEEIIEVEDNGVGFDYEQMKEEIRSGKRDSTGIFNIFYRFQIVMKAKVEVESHIGVGTIVRIHIPGEEENEDHCC